MRVLKPLRYPTIKSKLEALSMPDHCTPHVFYCLLCAVNIKTMKELLKHTILLVIVAEFMTGLFHVGILLSGQEFYLVLYPVMAGAIVASVLLSLIVEPFARWFLSIW